MNLAHNLAILALPFFGTPIMYGGDGIKNPHDYLERQSQSASFQSPSSPTKPPIPPKTVTTPLNPASSSSPAQTSTNASLTKLTTTSSTSSSSSATGPTSSLTTGVLSSSTTQSTTTQNITSQSTSTLVNNSTSPVPTTSTSTSLTSDVQSSSTNPSTTTTSSTPQTNPVISSSSSATLSGTLAQTAALVVASSALGSPSSSNGSSDINNLSATTVSNLDSPSSPTMETTTIKPKYESDPWILKKWHKGPVLHYTDLQAAMDPNNKKKTFGIKNEMQQSKWTTDSISDYINNRERPIIMFTVSSFKKLGLHMDEAARRGARKDLSSYANETEKDFESQYNELAEKLQQLYTQRVNSIDAIETEVDNTHAFAQTPNSTQRRLFKKLVIPAFKDLYIKIPSTNYEQEKTKQNKPLPQHGPTPQNPKPTPDEKKNNL